MKRFTGFTRNKDLIKPAHWRATLIAFTASLLPLLMFVPSHFSALFVASITWRIVTLPANRQPFAMVGLVIFTPATLIAIYAGLGVQSFTDSFLILLAAMGCAKLLETRNYRDLRVLFLLTLLMILAFLMYSQSVWIFLYAIFACGLTIWSLILIEHRHSHMIGLGRLQDIAKLLLVSLPITLMLFFLFPRIDPLWQMPRQQTSNITGLPDEMSMGDISSLVQSNEIAFRARFANDIIPASEKLYWRGPVLWYFDGDNWQQWAQDFNDSPKPITYQQESVIHYEVMPVKKGLHWLLALDLPISEPSGTNLGKAHQIRLPADQQRAGRYELTSALAYQQMSLTPKERAAALYFTDKIPKTQALAQRIWQNNGQTTAGFVQGFMHYFRDEEFYYSLEPPPGAGDVETFLFANGRIGFCEHYANALAQAARTVGIPSRVILGYQGGELNPLNGDWLVREESAHAWVEIWFDDIGWQRVDPTAAVAPERILQARLNADSLTYGEDSRAFGSRFAERLSAFAWTRNVMAYGQAFWQDWVIDLDRDRQTSLFAWSGRSTFVQVLIGLMIVIAGWVISNLLFIWWQRRQSNSLSPLVHALNTLLSRLEKKGYIKDSTESISAFLRRVAGNFSSPIQHQLLEVAIRYDRVRYLENESDNQLIRILKRIRL